MENCYILPDGTIYECPEHWNVALAIMAEVYRITPDSINEQYNTGLINQNEYDRKLREFFLYSEDYIMGRGCIKCVNRPWGHGVYINAFTHPTQRQIDAVFDAFGIDLLKEGVLY